MIRKNTMAITVSSINILMLLFYIAAPQRLVLFGFPISKLILLAFACVFIVLYRGHLNLNLRTSILLYIGLMLIPDLYHFQIQPLLWFSLEIVLILLALPDKFSNEKTFTKLIDAILILAGILSILGILETFTGFNLFDTISGSYVELYGANSLRFGLTRSRGFLTTSINNAVFLSIIASLCAYRISFANKSDKAKFIAIYFLVLCNLLCTISRGIILITIATQLVIWWKNGTIKNLKKILIIVISGAFLIFILELVGIPVISAFKNIYYSIMVIFNSDYSDSVAANFGTNLSGTGTRLDLFEMVYNAVKDNLILGMGYSNHFSVQLSATITKTSIENTFLANLYYCGIVGMVGFCIFLIGVIFRSVKNLKKRLHFEKRITFDWLMLIITIGYIASMFTVYAVDDLRLYYVLVMLAIARHKMMQSAS